MVDLRRPLTLLCWSCCVLIAEAADSERQLFASDDVLDVRIIAPVERIARLRPIDEDVAGTFSYMEQGEWIEYDVGIRARGRYRRQPGVCSFPPLRLNFRKSQADGTMFNGQDKLKLVTHCQSPSVRYEQAVIAEYLSYRILNLLTDFSFRVRLLKVRYTESGDGRSLDSYAFLIEHKNQVAKRVGLPVQEIAKTRASKVDAAHLSIISVYQYLIGNTDFSPVATAQGKTCCHNHVLFGEDGGPYYSIPYDFDMAGLVDAPHAEPNPKLRLYSVKERLYRGYCISNDRLPATLQVFLDKRAGIEELIESETLLTDRKRKDMLGFINQFYKEISQPRKVAKRLISKCK